MDGQTRSSAQRSSISRLARAGSGRIEPEYSYARVAQRLLGRVRRDAPSRCSSATPTSRASIPVRAAYPASVVVERCWRACSRDAGSAPDSLRCPDSTGAASRSRCSTPASTGRTRSCAGASRRRSTSSAATRDALAAARSRTTRPSSSGTGRRWPGLLVGAGGPGRLSGVAPRRDVLPIRVAGWQRDATARPGGLRAHRPGARRARARRRPERRRRRARRRAHRARRRRGAVRRLRRRPRCAGGRRRAAARHARRRRRRERRPGRARATAASPAPAAAPAALTVGAADACAGTAPRCRVVLRTGLHVVLDRRCRSPGASRRVRRVRAVAAHAGQSTARALGRAASVLLLGPRSQPRRRPRRARPGGDGSRRRVQRTPRAPAPSRSSFYGADLPPGGIGLDDGARRPGRLGSEPTRASCSPTHCARRDRRASRSARCGDTVEHREGRVAASPRPASPSTAASSPSSSRPGSRSRRPSPASTGDGSPRYGTVNGTSAAAALVAGAAALLAQARPDARRGRAARALLVGTATRARRTSRRPRRERACSTLGAARRRELAAAPTSLAFGRRLARWRVEREIVVRNVSTRRAPLTSTMRTRRRRSRGRPSSPSLASPLLAAAGERPAHPLTCAVAGAPTARRPRQGALVVTARRRFAAAASVDDHVRRASRRRCSARCVSRRESSRRPTRAGAADVPRRTVLTSTSGRDEVSPSRLLRAGAASPRRRRTSARSPGYAICCPAATPSASPGAARPGTRSARGVHAAASPRSRA